jgi:hypothetical protein
MNESLSDALLIHEEPICQAFSFYPSHATDFIQCYMEHQILLQNCTTCPGTASTRSFGMCCLQNLKAVRYEGNIKVLMYFQTSIL